MKLFVLWPVYNSIFFYKEQVKALQKPSKILGNYDITALLPTKNYTLYIPESTNYPATTITTSPFELSGHSLQLQKHLLLDLLDSKEVFKCIRGNLIQTTTF